MKLVSRANQSLESLETSSRRQSSADPAPARKCLGGGPDIAKTSPASDFSWAVGASPSGTQPSVPPRSAKADRELLEALRHSRIFADYERAFAQATGLPVALRPVESWQLAHHGKRNEGPFCALMAEKNRSCAACLGVQERLSQSAMFQPHTVVCPAGLSDTAVPVRLGDRLIGFLQTGQVFRRQPTERQFKQTARLLARWGVGVNNDELRQAFFATRVVPGKRHASTIKLLSIFAEHLSILSNQILVQRDNAESPLIAKAKAFIREHHAEPLHLGQVAKYVNTSPFYFCKLFKKGAGLNFTDYLCRIRVERAKSLLLNPNLRVGEIAYEVGFGSLTHFNRVFRNALGQTPTSYRSQFRQFWHTLCA